MKFILVDGWTGRKGLRCKPGYGAPFFKVKDLGFDDIVEDLEAGFCLRHDGEAFNFGSDSRCMNLRDIEFDKCERNMAFDLYRHGMYHKFYSKATELTSTTILIIFIFIV